MFKLVAVAAVAAVSAIGAAKMVGAGIAQPGAPKAEAAQTPDGLRPAVAPAGVVRSPDGHYWAEGVVNSTRVRFLVDTGATAVALTQTDARRLGFDPSGLDYRYSIATANGVAHGAEVKLASVSVAGASVADVEALVIDHGLSQSLLGMTYLGRLSRFEATPDTLILRP